jgi:Ni/Fe-hydrogenase subunit HybB-like protein
MTSRARPVGGRVVGPLFTAMLALWAAGTAAGLVRFTQGLGAATAMNDGYPWGLWIAFDVVVGTGLASGGYAIALLAYVLNRGRYHPLVRPALLTSFLGYSVAGVAIVFDVGRFWNLWRVPVMPWTWNGASVLLEVALCVMAYTAVLCVELAPAALEAAASGRSARARAMAARAARPLERALPYVIALGLVLPTMHQSSLGSLLLVAPTKVHALWHTPLLPLLFLLTALGMGYAIVVVESIFSSTGFGRERETGVLAGAGRVAALVSLLFVAIRLLDALVRGSLSLAFVPGHQALLFWAEIALLASPALFLLQERARESAGLQLQGALLLLLGGAAYRVDAYLVAFDPGPAFTYFPSVAEIAITLGLLATETMAYLWAVRRFPILAGADAARRAVALTPVRQEVAS